MRARILDFVQTLRARGGVEVSVAESLDALVAVAAVGVEREPMREALAAALVKHEADRPAFDRLFDEAFPLVGGAEEGRRRRRARGAGGGAVPTGAGRGAGDGGRSRLRDEREERGERATHGQGREASPGAEARHAGEGSGRESRAARAPRLLALPLSPRGPLCASGARLCRVWIGPGQVAPGGPLDLPAPSDLGRVLVGLWERRRARLTRSTLLLVLGDARNNRLPPRADLLRAIADRVQRIVWLVPEPRARWDTGDSVLGMYAPACEAVVECVDLGALVRAVRQAL